jgi:hypothetical protein
MATRGMTILNQQGDVTLVWEEEDDDKIIPVIEKKLAEGFAFFIIEPRLMGLMKPKKVRLTDAEEARRHRALAIRDEDLAGFLRAGDTAVTVRTPASRVRGSRKSTSASEIAAAESVAVQPMRGG